MGIMKKMRGFTVIEILVVTAIIGFFALAAYPQVMNTLETRSLENSAREILSMLQTARLRAIDTKDNHRVRFFQEGTSWRMILEQETSVDQWEPSRGFSARTIPPKFNFSVPDNAEFSAVFTSVGVVEGFDPQKNSISLQSDRLKGRNQPDERIIRFYGGGSVHYSKATS